MEAESGYKTPKRPIPEPLRGSEIGTFAHNTVAVRIPNIGRRILAENDFSPEIMARLQALIGDIPYGRICPLRDPTAPDSGDWARYVEPYVDQNWLQVPWFFAETYFYRRVLETTGYFRPGAGHGVDPYGRQKREGLESSQEAILAVAAHVNALLSRDESKPEDLSRLLKMNLWGNQADLSLWPAGHGEGPGHADDQARDAHLLADDSQRAGELLGASQGQRSRVDFILDNAGLELVNDLALADYLLGSQTAGRVRFHLKSHPTFVSDAMIEDVEQTVAFLLVAPNAEGRSFGQRLRDHLEEGRLQLEDSFFWTSPLALWEMPAQLRSVLGSAYLIVNKGDANYRRSLGDRHWPYTTPVAEALRYLPAPWVALRVAKSEVAIGLSLEQTRELDRIDPAWKVDGRWGMIQLVIL
ncbi:MAG TPA: damage-control phosphatase ARMT1 family protein [Anaerolineales bacterium]|nr:damage-control phosphatase ARMT1 family protein [Anaerolineales bacterium]